MVNIEMNFSAKGNSVQNNKITTKEIEKLLDRIEDKLALIDCRIDDITEEFENIKELLEDNK